MKILALIVAMPAVALAGCGGGAGNTSNGMANTAAAYNQTEPAAPLPVDPSNVADAANDVAPSQAAGNDIGAKPPEEADGNASK
jgi:hypothetical protein